MLARATILWVVGLLTCVPYGAYYLSDARDGAIDLIASDNHIPRFLAARIYDLSIRRMSGIARA